MSATRAAQLVRRWVLFYTQGLPDDVRDARRDEIDSDLWSQQAEVEPLIRSDQSLGTEILIRMFLGIPDDIAWRLVHAGVSRTKLERRATMGSRVVGLLAILGGVGMTIAGVIIFTLWLAHPDADPWWRLYDDADPVQWTLFSIGGVVGIISFGAAAIGLVVLFQDRLGSLAAIAGTVGALIGVLGQFTASPLGVLMPIGSAVVIWELGRRHLMGWALTIAFLGSAIAYVIPAAHLFGPTRLDATIALVIPYALAWVAVGAWLVRGIPSGEAVAPV